MRLLVVVRLRACTLGRLVCTTLPVRCERVSVLVPSVYTLYVFIMCVCLLTAIYTVYTWWCICQAVKCGYVGIATKGAKSLQGDKNDGV